MSVLIVIPARYKSSRFLGKPLKKILNKELIFWVLEKCKKVCKKNINLLVATDDKRIFNKVRGENYKAVMTSKKCLTGTDRVAEVYKKINAKIYINVQRDEPLVKVKDIKKIIKAKLKFPGKIICGYTYLGRTENPLNINIPKLVVNSKDELIYISRSSIPASKMYKKNKYYLKQVCVYAYSKQELNLFYSNKKTPLEKVEDIEILRFLEKGAKIQMVKLSSGSHAVDKKSDIKIVEKILSK